MNGFLSTFITAVLLLISAVSETESQWVHLGGPDGGGITCLYVTNCEVFAGTEKGLFFSTDGCKQWAKADSIKEDLKVVALAKSNYTFFAGTDAGGIYHSNDDGANWNKTNAFDSTLSIAVNDSFIIAGNTRGIQRCRVNDSVWTWVEFPGNGIVSVATRDSIVFAGGSSSGAFRSTDYGRSWSCMNTINFPASITSSFVLCGETVFASLFLDGVYRSTDNGVSWARCNGLSSIDYDDLATIDSTVIVSTSEGIFYTTDYGSTWYPTSSDLKDKNINCFFTAGNALYAGTVSDSVWYKSSTNSFVPVVTQKTQLPLSQSIDCRVRFNSSAKFPATIAFTLPKYMKVQVSVCDMRGCEIISLVNDYFNAGIHNIQWNTSKITSGFYFVKIYAETNLLTKNISIVN